MSMIGNELLNKIILERLIITPAEILSQLHDGIRTALKQDNAGSSTMDGMDVALCCINDNDKSVQYAGALRNLYVVDESELKEIKADKQSIGGVRSDVTKTFQNHFIPYSPGNIFYIFSDGYADQFGGNDGKKFMTRRFKDLLVSLKGVAMHDQKEAIKKSFNDWKQSHAQVDDVLVIGFKA
jgi:serine phosphatase RsbU (regulator of sigma subunit)